jgi:hypothetical protein
VVGQPDAVHAQLRRPERVSRSERALEQQLPRPPGPQRGDVRPVQVGIEEVRRPHHRREGPPGEVGVIEPGPGQQAVPVRGLQRDRRHRREGERRRDGKPVAQVTHPVTRHHRVHRHDEGRVSARGRPRHQVVGLHAVLGQVELEPERAVRAGVAVKVGDPGPQLLDSRRRHRGQRVRHAMAERRARRPDLPVRVQHPRVPGRPQQEWHRKRGPEQGSGRVGRGDAREHPRQEPPGAERGRVGGDRDFLVGGAVHVVEDGPRYPALSHPPQVGHVVTGAQAPFRRIERYPAQLDELAHFPHLHARDDTPRRPSPANAGSLTSNLSAKYSL